MDVYVVFAFYPYSDCEYPMGVFTSEQAAMMACLDLEGEAEDVDIEIEAYYVELPLDNPSACLMMDWYKIGKEVE